MSSDMQCAVHTKVYTTTDGRVAIEQSAHAVVVLPAAQIPDIIKELRVCYDYCASWKDTTDE